MKFFSLEKKLKQSYANALQELYSIYDKKIYPFEAHYFYHSFFETSRLLPGDFDQAALILFVGQHSTGIANFIKYLLEREYKGSKIDTAQTTEKFTNITHGKSDSVLQGNELCSDNNESCQNWWVLGTNFLEKFQDSVKNSPIVKNLTFDMSDIFLAGSKQTEGSENEYNKSMQLFAERADLIILMFDAQKLDTSDEIVNLISSLKPHDQKMRIILYNAEGVDEQELFGVYGALMWSLSKVFLTPEVPRVCFASFSDQPLQSSTEFGPLIEKESNELLREIQDLPLNVIRRNLDDLIKRANKVKMHALIIDELEKQKASFFRSKEFVKEKAIKNLPNIFKKVCDVNQIKETDLPDINIYAIQLEHHNIKDFPKLDEKSFNRFRSAIEEDIPILVERIYQKQEQDEQIKAKTGEVELARFQSTETSMAHDRGEGFDAGSMKPDEWIVEKFKEEYDRIFDAVNLENQEKLSVAQIEPIMLEYNLDKEELSKIWKLADYDKDNLLSKEEFALLMYCLRLKQEKWPLPENLPKHLIPPCFRNSQKISIESPAVTSIRTSSPCSAVSASSDGSHSSSSSRSPIVESF